MISLMMEARITSETAVNFYQTRSRMIALTIEAVSSSEASVNYYQTTQRNIPEDIFWRGFHKNKEFVGPLNNYYPPCVMDLLNTCLYFIRIFYPLSQENNKLLNKCSGRVGLDRWNT
jgi:hypothetical protein